jgi:hypothetical protein
VAKLLCPEVMASLFWEENWDMHQKDISGGLMAAILERSAAKARKELYVSQDCP